MHAKAGTDNGMATAALTAAAAAPPGDGATEIAPPSESADVKSAANPAFKKGFRFYAIIAAIVLAGVLTALEGTITSTALPSIVADLGGGDLYVWAVNGYFLAM